jgi:hypothetical protein
MLAEPLIEAETEAEVEAEAEGRAQALFLAIGEAKAGAARARTGRTDRRVEASIVIVCVDRGETSVCDVMK